ncbi:HpcH/HpaI aldolase/citrate lyase family protein [Alkalicoccus saliphilus]|uniref:CoA ester lyase n=1 Tax=Alkalicoccus saliphilus TaxID=200989 RepID=A0A2T4U4Q0_9BACI|nr:CoA ester lyase [Alkalicoccus saliphilus]PTL38378.1 CoA ester lyase [Alkalicoccus saliphilus]
MVHKSIRRSLLYVPGNSEKMIEKSLKIEADSIILDLEDAVSLTEKSNARKLVKKHIGSFKEINKEVMIRINDITTRDGILDLEAVVEEQPNTIIIPKAYEHAIQTADVLIKALEIRFDIQDFEVNIIPLLETSYSIANAFSILSASERISGVQFGAEDLTNELGIERTSEGKEVAYARNVIVHAGNACKIDILDTPFTDIGDKQNMIKDTSYAKSIGFTGKTCIHPSQVEIVNDVFTPKAEEIEKARELLRVFEKAKNSGEGVCMFEGKMIDNPIAERAKKLVAKGEAVGY